MTTKTNKNKIKKASLVLLTVLLLGLLSGCSNTSNKTNNGSGTSANSSNGKNTVTLGYLPITHALAIFEEKELLEAENANIQIELKKFGSWTDLTDALNSGQIDGASVLIELAMNAVGNGIDLKAVALGHKDGNIVVVSNDINSAKDLKGKNFAIPSNQSSHNILLSDMLKEAGLTPNDLTITQLAPAEMPSSLANGSIDGYCVAEPFGAQAVVLGFGKVLYKSNELWENSQCCAFVLNTSFMRKNQEIADLLISYYFKAGKALNTETAQKIAEQYLGQNQQTLEESLQWIQYEDLALTKEDYAILSEKVISYGINNNPPSYEDFVYKPGQNDSKE